MNTEDAAFGRSVGAQAAFARGLAAGCAAVLAPTAVAAR